MMGGKVGNKSAVLFFQRADASENFGIEIGEPEPENIFLFGDTFVELQQFAEDAAASGGVNQPARGDCGFAFGRIAKSDAVQRAGRRTVAEIHSGDGAVDELHARFEISAADFAVEGEAVNLEGEQRRNRGRFVDDIGAVGGIVDIRLEIIGEAVFREVIFDEVRPKAEFEQKIDGDFDKGFADDGTIFVRTFDDGDFQLRELQAQIGGGKLAGGSASHDENVSGHRGHWL